MKLSVDNDKIVQVEDSTKIRLMEAACENADFILFIF